MMKRLWLAAALLLSGSPVFAAEKMQTASAAGAYNTKICPAIAASLAKTGLSLTCEQSAGSGQNFDDVFKGTVPLALGQLDVFGLKLLEDQAKGGNATEAMGSVGFIVPEALFCVAKKGGRIPTANAWGVLNDSEKPDKPYVVSTYGPSSGPAGTLGFLRKTFPSFGKNVDVKYQDNFKFDVEAGRLRAGLRDMVCFVNMSNPADERVMTTVASDDLFFVPLDSPLLATPQINGRPAYQIMAAPLTGGFLGMGGTQVRTIHTGVTVYMNVDKISDPLYKAVVAALRDPDLLPKGDALSTLAQWSDKAMGAGKNLYNEVVRR